MCVIADVSKLWHTLAPLKKENGMIDNNGLIASEPTHKKVQRYIIGVLNGKQVHADAPEYLGLVSQVTVEEMPPGGYSGGIRERLWQLQNELQALPRYDQRPDAAGTAKASVHGDDALAKKGDP